MSLSGTLANVQRSAVNLAPTLKATARGVPVASRINFTASSANDHDHHHDVSTRTNFRVPSWSMRTGVSPLGSGMSVRSANNTHPSRPSQVRFISSQSSTTDIPDYSNYTGKAPGSKNRNFSYFMVGTMGAVTAVGAKSLLTDFLSTMAPSADVLALAKVEVDLSAVPEGKNIIIKWRGKPVFIRHRTAAEISEANAVDVQSLRDPQADADRTQKPEWLVMIGICTHLGCVPIGEAGDYGGWYCPCHGSHYDISGRVRRGPAPLNLEVPEYSFPEDKKLIIG